MQLTVVRRDPIHSHVLRGVAEQSGWRVSHAGRRARGADRP